VRLCFKTNLRVRKVLDELAEGHREEFGRPPQLRHILLYLLFPGDYERIASEGHKGRICEAFSEILDAEAPEDTDDHLKAIRSKLHEFLKRDLTSIGNRCAPVGTRMVRAKR
jgi:5-methylcytosine-specific restriction enzyme B